MITKNSPLIHPRDIKGDNNVRIDARSGPGAHDRYLEKHLSGALHVDLDRDLSSKPIDPAYGGRHPLPDIKGFAALLGKLGITPSSNVIIYDDKNGANAAARLWWMLRAVGHEKLHVVDGGLDAIIREGLQMASGTEVPNSTRAYPVSNWLLPIVTLNEVVDKAESEEYLVVDVRESYRYRGEAEPIDLVAGHIPGAINIPYIDNLAEDGSFRPSDDLAKTYKSKIGDRPSSNIIVHCGSGVTACHTLLALEHAGVKGANLYVGSWSEWSRRGLPIATGDK